MSSAVVETQEKEMAEFGSDISNVNPSDYCCQILQEKTTLEAANDKSLPNDARLNIIINVLLNFITNQFVDLI